MDFFSSLQITMPIFHYTAYTASEKEVRGSVEAESVAEAASVLKRDGLFPREIALPSARKGFRRKKVSVNELASLTRRLSTLIGAGCALFDALRLLSDEEENAEIKAALISIREEISGGSTLSRALEAQKVIFPELFIRTVEAGEHGGTLDKVLLRLSDFLDARGRIEDRVRSALLYPALMAIVGALVLSFLFIFVIPRITAIFEDSGQSLPLITKALLFFVGVLTGWWHALIAIAALFFISARRYLRTLNGKTARDSFLLRGPVIGRLYFKFQMASFARTLGSLLSSGVPIIGALNMTSKVLGNTVLEAALSKAVKDLTEGSPLSVSLKASSVFPPTLVHMVTTGERSGELPALLIKTADAYEKEFESGVARALTLIEPMMVLAMGAIVGFIVLAILLPIFELNQVIR